MGMPEDAEQPGVIDRLRADLARALEVVEEKAAHVIQLQRLVDKQRVEVAAARSAQGKLLARGQLLDDELRRIRRREEHWKESREQTRHALLAHANESIEEAAIRVVGELHELRVRVRLLQAQVDALTKPGAAA